MKPSSPYECFEKQQGKDLTLAYFSIWHVWKNEYSRILHWFNRYENYQRNKFPKRWMHVATKVASGCWSGGGERWGVAWWGNEQQLSPINSPYLSPSFSTVTTYPHCFAIWWLHLLLYGLYFMKIIFCCRPPLFISFQVQERLSRRRFENFSNCDKTRLPLRDEQSFCFPFYCSDFVSELLYHPFSSARW